MASAADLTAYDAALKVHYTRDRIVDMTYRNNPLFAMIPKYTAFGGKNLPIPINYGNPQGRSKTFSNAKTRAQASSSSITDFVLTRVKDYSIVTIDNETLLATQGDSNAFVEAATNEIDGGINSLKRSLAINLYLDSSAAYGQVNAEPSTNSGNFVVTLKQTQDVKRFEVGQMVVIYSAKSGGSQRTSDGSDNEWVIEAVDRNAGTITLTGNYDASGDIAADDYLFIEGDRGLGVSGLEDWIPATAPGATSFFGVDRSSDVTRLGGHRLDGSSAPLEEVLIEGDSIVAGEGFGLTHYFMNNKKMAELKKSLGSKVQYVDVEINPRISFRGILVEGEMGPIKVIGDHNCPFDRCFGLNMNYVKFYTLGDPTRALDTDGNYMLRQSDDDGVEVRFGFYGQLGIRAPGSCINIQL